MKVSSKRLSWVTAVLGGAVLFAATAILPPLAAEDAEDDTGSSDAQTLDPKLVARGKRLYVFCQACHSTEAVLDSKIGPHLEGIVDRPVAAVDGSTYSDALREQDFAWTEEKLDLWLQQPSNMVPGTIMSFVGIPQPELRSALIAYLKTL